MFLTSIIISDYLYKKSEIDSWKIQKKICSFSCKTMIYCHSEVSQRQQAVTSHPRKGVMLMSDFELLSVMLSVILIVVTVLVNTNKK